MSLEQEPRGSAAPGLEPSEARLRRICLTLALLIGPPALLFLYAKLTFVGLTNPEALDFAQLGRNLSAGRGFMTDVVRPLAMSHGADPLRQPEVVHGPLYPIMLALAFGALGAREWVAALVSSLFFLATLPVVYHLGRRLFSPLVGTLAVVTLAVNARMLDYALSGLHITLYIFLITALLLALHGLSERDRFPRGRLILIGALAAALYLTEPLFIWVAPVAFAAVGVTRRAAWVKSMGLALVPFAVMVAPWMLRNAGLTGNPVFGLAGSEVFMNTTSYPGDQLYRLLPSELTTGVGVFRAFMKKVGLGLGDVLETLPSLTASWLLAFFLPSLFFRFSDPAARRLRGSVLWSFAALLLGTVLFRVQMPIFTALVPAVVVFSLAFVLHLGRQAQLTRGGWATATVALVVLSGYPVVKDLAFTPKTDPLPYAEYAQAFGAVAGSREVVLTDQPGLVAWYAGTPSVWLPASDNRVPEVLKHFPNARWLFLTGQARAHSRGWRSIYDGFAEGIYKRETLRLAKQPFPEKVRINAQGDPLLEAVSGSTWVPVGEHPTLEVIVASLPDDSGADANQARQPETDPNL